jgi:hypothetical protein
MPVYAGAARFVGFTAASSALAAARQLQETAPPGHPAARTVVLFFHHRAALPGVLALGNELLAHAEHSSPEEDVLVVGVTGWAEDRPCWSMQPWGQAVPSGAINPVHENRTGVARLFETFIRDVDRTLSLRLAAALERDQVTLLTLGRPRLLMAEIRRLTRAHGGDAHDAEALAQLSVSELASDGARRGITAWAAPGIARLAAFMSRECR